VQHRPIFPHPLRQTGALAFDTEWKAVGDTHSSTISVAPTHDSIRPRWREHLNVSS
jgi:hypothetical protein